MAEIIIIIWHTLSNSGFTRQPTSSCKVNDGSTFIIVVVYRPFSEGVVTTYSAILEYNRRNSEFVLLLAAPTELARTVISVSLGCQA